MATSNEAKSKSLFQELYNMDISGLISQLDKQTRSGKNFSVDYIEWAEAWRAIKTFDADAEFEVLENSEGLPFFDSKYGVFVKVKVTVKDKTVIEKYAVDEEKVCAQDINNACQRALVKALGRLGFGLQLWIEEERLKLKQVRPKEYTGDSTRSTDDKPRSMIDRNHIVGFGKFKGKVLGDIDPKQLINYVGWLKEDADKKNIPMQGEPLAISNWVAMNLQSKEMADNEPAPSASTMIPARQTSSAPIR